MRIFTGLIIVFIGFVLIWKTEWFVRNFGHISWAERTIGIFGGTRTVIKVVAIFGIFLGFLYLTNQIDDFFGFVFGWMVPGVLKS